MTKKTTLQLALGAKEEVVLAEEKKKNPHLLAFEARVGGWGTRNLCLAQFSRLERGWEMGHKCQLSTSKARDLFGCRVGDMRGSRSLVSRGALCNFNQQHDQHDHSNQPNGCLSLRGYPLAIGGSVQYATSYPAFHLTQRKPLNRETHIDHENFWWSSSLRPRNTRGTLIKNQ